MTDSMLEKMAKAIDPYAFEPMSVHVSSASRAQAIAEAISAAKAALQAIREPSEALIEAAYETPSDAWEPPYLGDVHKSIIDAILSGEV